METGTARTSGRTGQGAIAVTRRRCTDGKAPVTNVLARVLPMSLPPTASRTLGTRCIGAFYPEGVIQPAGSVFEQPLRSRDSGGTPVSQGARSATLGFGI